MTNGIKKYKYNLLYSYQLQLSQLAEYKPES